MDVRRCRRTGTFLLNPKGTFRRYGGYVSVNPYRELPAGAGPDELGAAVIGLLARSGPTGVAMAQASEFLRATADAETQRVRTAHRLDGRLGTSALARRFASATAWLRDGQRAWRVQGLEYDPTDRVLSGAGIAPVRVLHRAGAAALGAALRVLLGADPAEPGAPPDPAA